MLTFVNFFTMITIWGLLLILLMLVKMLPWGHDLTAIGISNLSDRNNIILSQNHDMLKGMSFLICY